jgi:hypothetical protein
MKKKKYIYFRYFKKKRKFIDLLETNNMNEFLKSYLFYLNPNLIDLYLKKETKRFKTDIKNDKYLIHDYMQELISI